MRIACLTTLVLVAACSSIYGQTSSASSAGQSTIAILPGDTEQIGGIDGVGGEMIPLWTGPEDDAAAIRDWLLPTLRSGVVEMGGLALTSLPWSPVAVDLRTEDNVTVSVRVSAVVLVAPLQSNTTTVELSSGTTITVAETAEAVKEKLGWD